LVAAALVARVFAQLRQLPIQAVEAVVALRLLTLRFQRLILTTPKHTPLLV